MCDLDGFDFAAQRSLDRRQIRELAGCRWGAHGEALPLLGPSGVGKTHLAIALGRAAIREGYSVLFVTAPALVAALAKAHAEGRLEERLSFFAKPMLRQTRGDRSAMHGSPYGLRGRPAPPATLQSQ